MHHTRSKCVTCPSHAESCDALISFVLSGRALNTLDLRYAFQHRASYVSITAVQLDLEALPCIDKFSISWFADSTC
jgi:hypothetical protein